jgi:hypothetical protein
MVLIFEMKDRLRDEQPGRGAQRKALSGLGSEPFALAADAAYANSAR